MWVPATYWIVVLPHWFITIVFAILPAVWLRHRLRLRRRVKSRLCRRCGYDLRFSAGRCPECGEAIDGEASVPA
jgi:predicted amidophosphoribosyltransferase